LLAAPTPAGSARLKDDTEESAWVGTASETTAPADAQPTVGQTMTLEPPEQDQSAVDTAAAEAQTWASQNAYMATDLNGNVINSSSSEDNADMTPPTDAYGYQSIGPDNNYDPNIAADGTDLGGVAVTPDSTSYCYLLKVVKVASTTSTERRSPT